MLVKKIQAKPSQAKPGYSRPKRQTGVISGAGWNMGYSVLNSATMPAIVRPKTIIITPDMRRI